MHNVGFVDSRDSVATNAFGIVEGISCDAFRCLPCDKLNGLDNTVDDLMFNARIFSFSILSDEDSVDVVVGSFEAGNREAWSHVCEEVECSSEGQVEGDMAFSDCGMLAPINAMEGPERTRSGQWSFKRDEIQLLHPCL